MKPGSTTSPAQTGIVRHIVDPIHGSISLTSVEAQVVDHPAFQRLRKIKQLGNAHFVYPGATHTRFVHSLGVMHLAGALFDSLLRSKLPLVTDPKQHAELRGAITRIRQRVRLAGLMHDVGHGPFSHQFESALVRFEGDQEIHLKVSDLSPELSVPSSWILSKRRDEYFSGKLQHEYFSYGLIRVITESLQGPDFEYQGVDICSLLDNRFQPSKDFERDLGVLAKSYGSKDTESLKKCLKSILSGELDADRLDYLQRDSYYCGIRIAGVDLPHLLNSIELCSGEDGEFFILLKRNAVASVDQVLISRKQMFDQVYSHRVNAMFDDALESLLKYLIRNGKLESPTRYLDFTRLSDEGIEERFRRLWIDYPPEPLPKVQEALRLYLTRTTLQKVAETVVDEAEVSGEVSRLKREYPEADGYLVRTFELKAFTNLDRDDEAKRNSLIKVQPDFTSEPIPVNVESEVFRSNLWRSHKVRIVVFRSFAETAKARKLDRKVKALIGPEAPKEASRGNAKGRSKPRR